jgi:hypothetical protein
MRPSHFWISRLTELLPRTTPALQPPARADWKTALAGWFDVSAWQWNWRSAGLMGATAMALVVSVVAIRSWQRIEPSPASSELHVAAQSDASLNAPPAAAATPSADAQTDSIAPGRTESVAQPAAPSPSPLTRAGSPAPTPSPAEQRESLFASGVASGIPAAAPLIATEAAPPSPKVADLAQAQVPQQAIPLNAPGAPPPAPVVERTDQSEPLSPESAEPSNRLGPSSEDNPMRGEAAKPAKASRPEAAKKANWIDRVMAFAPNRKGDRRNPDAPVIRDEEETRYLISRIHNRVFRFENGVWVDQEYKDDVMKWRVTRLVRGSEEFNQTLAATPQLKPYFDKAPILVIWRDKIYRVVLK